jgi:hypothetical protein
MGFANATTKEKKAKNPSNGTEFLLIQEAWGTLAFNVSRLGNPITFFRLFLSQSIKKNNKESRKASGF